MFFLNITGGDFHIIAMSANFNLIGNLWEELKIRETLSSSAEVNNQNTRANVLKSDF